MNYSHSRTRRRRGNFVFNRTWRKHSKLFISVLIAVLVLAAAATLPVSGQATPDLVPSTTYFSQDFSASTVVADYASIAPNMGQFNAISSTGAGMTISINGGQLQYSRTANSGAFSRTSDFAPTPATMRYSFDLTVAGNTTAQTTAAVFQVGGGFGVSNSAEVNANVFSRVGVNFTATNGQWSLRDIQGAVNTPNFTGTQTVTWFLNNSDAALNYLAPDGSSDTLADNTADLWIGTTRVFNDFAATTPTQTLTDIKFVFTAGTGTIQIDNIQISDIAGPTSASVSISGRVSDLFGNPIRDAVMLIEGPLLDRPRATRVSAFGHYRFDGLQVGTYNVTVNSRRSVFSVQTRTLTLQESVADVDFVAQPEK